MLSKITSKSAQQKIIKKDWKIPKCNIEGYKPVVFFYKNGDILLDFLNEEKADFLSEYDELFIDIEYPFIEKYNPTIEDWEQLGFITLFA